MVDPLTTVRPIRRYQRLGTTILDDRTAMEAAFEVPLTDFLSEGILRIPPVLPHADGPGFDNP